MSISVRCASNAQPRNTLSMGAFQNDLTVGSVSRQLIRFSVPFLISNLLQSCYTLVDMLVVSMYCGEAGISAVTIGGQLTNTVLTLITGMTTAGTIVVAQYYGARREEDEKQTVGTIITFFMLIGVGLTALTLALSAPLLRLLGTPGEVFGDAKSVFDISMMGTIFVFGYNIISSILRGKGDSKRPLYFVIIAAALNVGLDFWFVGGLNLGPSGATLATILSQAVSLILSSIYLVRQGFFEGYTRVHFRINREKVSMLLKIGVPSALQGFIVMSSFMVLMIFANQLPDPIIATACIGIGSRINSFAILPGMAIAGAIASMVGQNVGAKHFDRARKCMIVGLEMSLGLAFVCFALVNLWPGFFIGIFSDNPETISAGIGYIRGVSYDYLFTSIVFSLNALAIGSGYTSYAMANALISSTFTRIPLTYLFSVVFGMGLSGLGLGVGLAPIGSIFFGIWFVLSKKWQKPRLRPGSGAGQLE